jgi:hypothetical protein
VFADAQRVIESDVIAEGFTLLAAQLPLNATDREL